MAKLSAALVVYRSAPADGHLEVLLVHPGGPFWAKKDDGAWSLPKGEHGPDEDAYAAARREFAEELGLDPPRGDALDLGEIVQRGGKRVHAWALAGDVDVTATTSNTFEMEWPPRSGELRSFPEVDRAEWFSVEAARVKLIGAQVELVERLLATRG